MCFKGVARLCAKLFGIVDATDDNGSGSNREFPKRGARIKNYLVDGQLEERESGNSAAVILLKARTDDLVGQSVVMKAYIRPMDTSRKSGSFRLFTFPSAVSNSDARVDGECVR